ncbi:hypothetical protein F8388_012145 [Cannabis sativa]|uniref:Transposase Tnp1/En/Spm-like domain-containing protein n=1 Tax=Cannabis sativa TaxID=3483 RepID=A0A7J6EJV4_CANSA|nr:hypothetical protein F8388_012145 [Cannabis sativa]
MFDCESHLRLLITMTMPLLHNWLHSSKEVGGKELEDHFSEVVVQVCINSDEELIRPYGQCKTICEVVGASIAWPTTFLVSRKLNNFMTQ